MESVYSFFLCIFNFICINDAIYNALVLVEQNKNDEKVKDQNNTNFIHKCYFISYLNDLINNCIQNKTFKLKHVMYILIDD